MVFHATAWVLAFSTLIGPSLCCCTTASVVSSISSLMGGSPVTCQPTQCCHADSTSLAKHRHESRHARHDHKHGESHDATLSQPTPSKHGQKTAPRECPCRKDRGEAIALPVVAEAAASVGQAPLDWVWAAVVFAPFGANSTGFTHTTSSHGPDTACLSGREILRAHCVLRI